MTLTPTTTTTMRLALLVALLLCGHTVVDATPSSVAGHRLDVFEHIACALSPADAAVLPSAPHCWGLTTDYHPQAGGGRVPAPRTTPLSTVAIVDRTAYMGIAAATGQLVCWGDRNWVDACNAMTATGTVFRGGVTGATHTGCGITDVTQPNNVRCWADEKCALLGPACPLKPVFQSMNTELATEPASAFTWTAIELSPAGAFLCGTVRVADPQATKADGTPDMLARGNFKCVGNYEAALGAEAWELFIGHVASFSVSWNSVCAVFTDNVWQPTAGMQGSVRCFGTSTGAHMSLPSGFERVARRRFVSVTTYGSTHTCAADEQGFAYCWGRDYRTRTPVVPPGTRYVGSSATAPARIAVGDDFACGWRVAESPMGGAGSGIDVLAARVSCWPSDDGDHSEVFVPPSNFAVDNNIVDVPFTNVLHAKLQVPSAVGGVMSAGSGVAGWSQQQQQQQRLRLPQTADAYPMCNGLPPLPSYAHTCVCRYHGYNGEERTQCTTVSACALLADGNAYCLPKRASAVAAAAATASQSSWWWAWKWTQ